MAILFVSMFSTLREESGGQGRSSRRGVGYSKKLSSFAISPAMITKLFFDPVVPFDAESFKQLCVMNPEAVFELTKDGGLEDDVIQHLQAFGLVPIIDSLLHGFVGSFNPQVSG